ncbi:MAG TPA: VanZ family protein [Bacteroidaceae bacterium]|nr:VanZ family protein [Bacteroidaceae bacterium]
MIRVFKKYPLSILAILAITLLSLINTPQSNIESFKLSDKIAHFFLYLFFELLLWFEHGKNNNCFPKISNLIIIIIFPILFGGVMELGQKYLTETRSAEWLDFIANTAGVLTAAVIGAFVLWPIQKKRYMS